MLSEKDAARGVAQWAPGLAYHTALVLLHAASPSKTKRGIGWWGASEVTSESCLQFSTASPNSVQK